MYSDNIWRRAVCHVYGRNKRLWHIGYLCFRSVQEPPSYHPRYSDYRAIFLSFEFCTVKSDYLCQAIWITVACLSLALLIYRPLHRLSFRLSLMTYAAPLLAAWAKPLCLSSCCQQSSSSSRCSHLLCLISVARLRKSQFRFFSRFLSSVISQPTSLAEADLPLGR